MIFKTEEVHGCRVQLNPNGSDLRCGDRINNLNWNQNEGVVQLCPMCQLKQKNNTLIEMVNRQREEMRNT